MQIIIQETMKVLYLQQFIALRYDKGAIISI